MAEGWPSYLQPGEYEGQKEWLSYLQPGKDERQKGWPSYLQARKDGGQKGWLNYPQHGKDGEQKNEWPSYPQAGKGGGQKEWMSYLQPGKEEGQKKEWPSYLKPVEYEGQKKGTMKQLVELDDSLTSLMWLKDFSIIKSSCCPSGPDPPNCYRIPSFDAPCSPLAADPACMDMPHAPCKPISSSTLRTPQHATAMPTQLPEDINYKTNPHVKPPYSYATLICMAMEAAKEPKITLSAIYKWITDNFCYFRHADPTWQNSIRHNLSLNKSFIKVPREKGEPGKGGFWKLDPQYAERLKSGAVKKRRVSPVQICPTSTTRAQQEARCVTSTAASACTSHDTLSIDTESQQLLKEFEEITGRQNWDAEDGKAGHKRKQPLPERTAKVARLCDSALLTQEEQTELGSLKGDFDWEAIFNSTLNEDASIFAELDLVPPISPITRDLDLMVQGYQIDCPQGQEQERVLAECNENNWGFDETAMATAFLKHSWDEGTNDCLSNCINIDQLFDFNGTSLPADVSDSSNLASLL